MPSEIDQFIIERLIIIVKKVAREDEGSTQTTARQAFINRLDNDMKVPGKTGTFIARHNEDHDA